MTSFDVNYGRIERVWTLLQWVWLHWTLNRRHWLTGVVAISGVSVSDLEHDPHIDTPQPGVNILQQKGMIIDWKIGFFEQQINEKRIKFANLNCWQSLIQISHFLSILCSRRLFFCNFWRIFPPVYNRPQVLTVGSTIIELTFCSIELGMYYVMNPIKQISDL